MGVERWEWRDGRGEMGVEIVESGVESVVERV